jgi:hypothetical protein
MSGRRTIILFLLAVVALLGTTSVLAAANAVSLDLKGGYANRTLTACAARHHFTYFRLRSPIAMGGSVSPAPTATAWRAKVKVKRCVAGRFRTVWFGYTAGQKDGSFHIVYRPRFRGFFFGRAYYYGVRPTATSDKQYFHVG